jgi:S1-C subfamily serine protease
MQGRSAVVVAAVSATLAAAASVIATLLVVGTGPGAAITGRSGQTSTDAPTGLPEVVAGLGSGVVRIETTACSGGSVGSGFLVGPDLVATVGHVVTGAHKIVLTAGGDAVPGTVVGLDAVADLALVRADRPFAGHVFTLAETAPQVGAQVVGLGYPLGGGLALVHGVVSGVDRSMTVSPGTAAAAASSAVSARPIPSTIGHLIQVDGLFSAGDSGGPLVADDGAVVGLVEARATQAQGVGFAVSASLARQAVGRWRAHPQPVQVSGDCTAPVGPPEAVAQVNDVSGSPDGPAVQALLGRFATALNAGRYDEAFALFTPVAQRRTTLAAWTMQERSSRLFDLVVHHVTPDAAQTGAALPDAAQTGTAPPGTALPGAAAAGGSLSAQITFTSVQDAALGPNGQVCSLWQLTYLLVRVEGQWRIDRAAPQPDSPQAC